MAVVVERTTAKATVSSGNAVASFTGTPTIGNRIIALGHVWDGGGAPGSATITDQDSNSYTSHRTQLTTNSQGRAFNASALIAATRSGLQVTLSGQASDAKTFSAMEVSGLASSPLDVATSSESDDTSPYELARGALVHADELVCGNFVYIGTADQNDNITLTSWGGISPTTLWTENGPGIVGEFGAAGYKIVSSASSVTVGFVGDQNVDTAIVACTFKGAILIPRERSRDMKALLRDHASGFPSSPAKPRSRSAGTRRCSAGTRGRGRGCRSRRRKSH